MSTINIKVLNEVLDLKTKSKYLVQTQKGHQGVPSDYDGYQGEYN